MGTFQRIRKFVLHANVVIALLTLSGCNGYSLTTPSLAVTDPGWICAVANTQNNCKDADTDVANQDPNNYCVWYSTVNNDAGVGFGFRDLARSGLNPDTIPLEVEDATLRGDLGLCRLYVFVPEAPIIEPE